jgi:hypothetical protein
MLRSWTALAGVLAASLVLAEEANSTVTVKSADLPVGLFAGEGSAIAYSVEGKPRYRYTRAVFPLERLRRSSDRNQDFLLLAYSNGRYWPVSARREGDALVAEVTRGPLYVVVEKPIDHLTRTFDLFCRFRAAAEERADRRPFLPKICTQILCSAAKVDAQTLLTQFGVPGLDLGPGNPTYGGWTTVPQDLCAECTRPHPGGDPPAPPTLSCLTLDTGACSAGTPLFADDFTADAPGSAPSTSPPGPPADDSLAYQGSVSVASVPAFGGNAVRIARSVAADSRLDAVLGAGATDSGVYCISFRGQTEIADTSIDIGLRAPNGSEAWHLRLGGSGSTFVSGGAGTWDLAPYLPSGAPHRFRIALDLSAGLMTLSIDGATVASGLPLLSPDFTIPERLRFNYIQMLLEGYPGQYVVDDIRVRRIN